jgi:beta-lactamase regulating signal transducer with metallopeptidase domain
MDVLLPIALKSFIVAGFALLALKLAHKRSAAERSWIAHLGLAAVLLLPIAAVALPVLAVEAPEFVSAPPAQTPVVAAAAPSVTETEAAAPAATFPDADAAPFLAGTDWRIWIYAAPAGLLVLLTLIALGRLFTLRAHADVLVEPHWLTALARAQHRMGFKHGTALLTSDELPSPISWGVMRPVILLNREAANSHAEAEAIIAHELAHVAGLDWAKLLLSRVATALFWFNPMVWLLAREAHQLREEAADDAVLGSDIVDTDYAQLLVGVARHECRGLLIGAHGVAPAKNSLTRRVRRVLDAGSVRGPVGRAFALGMFSGAVVLAAPLAALTLRPASSSDTSKPYYARAEAAPSSKPMTPALASTLAEAAAPLAADGAAGSVAQVAAGAAAVAAHPHLPIDIDEGVVRTEPNGATVAKVNGRTVMTSPSGATVTVFPPDTQGRQKVVMRSPSGGTISYPDARTVPGMMPTPPTPPRPRKARSEIDEIIEMKALGISPEWVSAMRAASPRLRGVAAEDMIELKAVGVTPAYVRDMSAAGYGHLDVDDLVEARALGITADYVRSLSAAGYSGLSMDRLTDMRAVGVTASDLRGRRASGQQVPVGEAGKHKSRRIDNDGEAEPGPGG